MTSEDKRNFAFLVPPCFAASTSNSNETETRIQGYILQVGNRRSSPSKRVAVLKSVSRHILSPIRSFSHSQDQKDEFNKRIDLFVNSQPVEGAQIYALVLPHVDSDPSTSLSASELITMYENDNRKICATSDVEGHFALTLYDHQLEIPHLSVALFTEHAAEVEILQIPIIESDSGLSVISDIDDTIKETKVYNGLIATLKTALLNSQVPVEGMNQLYQSIGAKYDDNLSTTAFHYISAAPFLFMPTVLSFLVANDFPITSVTLRSLKHEKSAKDYKVKCVKELFRRLPGRRFILIGDSGEFDQAVYEEIQQWALSSSRAGERVGSVEGIYIREVTPAADLGPEQRDSLPKSRPIDNSSSPVKFFSNGNDLSSDL